MTDPAPLQIALDPATRAVLIKASGACTARACLPIRAYLESLAPKAVDTVHFQLAEAKTIDSTFAGFLLETLQRLQMRGDAFFLVSPSEGVMKTLETMGVAQMLQISETMPTPGGEWIALPTDVDSKELLREIIVDAHERLMALSEENRRVFGPVVDGFRKADG